MTNTPQGCGLKSNTGTLGYLDSYSALAWKSCRNLVSKNSASPSILA